MDGSLRFQRGGQAMRARRRRRIAGRLVLRALALWLAGSVAGCSLNELRTPQRLDRGLVVILPGIEGRSVLNESLAMGLSAGGVDCAIEIFEWGTPIPGGLLINITDFERNKAVAQRLNNRIITYRHHHPASPVHVIGHSGGGGLAIMAAERLPPGIEVSSIVLLAPAISPAYDLSGALEHSRFGVFNYYSPYDAVFLRLGTSVAGTMDRQHGQSAGAVGFRPAGGGEAKAGSDYRKLHQIEWSPDMRWAGNFGGHTDWTHYSFVKAYLAPLITELGGPLVPPDEEPESLALESRD